VQQGLGHGHVQRGVGREVYRHAVFVSIFRRLLHLVTDAQGHEGVSNISIVVCMALMHRLEVLGTLMLACHGSISGSQAASRLLKVSTRSDTVVLSIIYQGQHPRPLLSAIGVSETTTARAGVRTRTFWAVQSKMEMCAGPMDTSASGMFLPPQSSMSLMSTPFTSISIYPKIHGHCELWRVIL